MTGDEKPISMKRLNDAGNGLIVENILNHNLKKASQQKTKKFFLLDGIALAPSILSC